MNRPNWNQYFREITELTATRSTCDRLHVGCILVKNNRIVSQGYNGFLPGCPHESHIVDGHEVGTVHAEQNAIVDCAKRGVSCDECTAYVTHYPCLNCTKILLSGGIKEILYINNYHNNELVEKFCKEMDCTISKLTEKFEKDKIIPPEFFEY